MPITTTGQPDTEGRPKRQYKQDKFGTGGRQDTLGKDPQTSLYGDYDPDAERSELESMSIDELYKISIDEDQSSRVRKLANKLIEKRTKEENAKI